MELVFCNGLTENCMMVNFKMIKEKALESSPGRTVEYMMENGKKGNKMAKACLLTN